MYKPFNLPKQTTCEMQIKTMIFGPKAHFDPVYIDQWSLTGNQ